MNQEILLVTDVQNTMTAEEKMNNEEEAKINHLLLLDLNIDTGAGDMLLDTLVRN